MGPKKQKPETPPNPELDEYIDSLNPDPTDLIGTYKPDCVQKIGNFASADSRYLFEYAGDDREHLNWLKIEHLSPKLYRMLREIQEQDEEDMRVHGRKFKHFIFSNIKSGTFGAKIIATALIDIFGMRLGYKAAKHQRVLKKDPNWGKITLVDPDVLRATKGENFYLLSSVGVYEQPLSVPMRKEILKRFNSRPDNVYGDVARIIIMDAGFKEGIDLFDIKYVHIFEPQTTLADQKQVIGRGTRTCGQKGLDFHPTKGWPLYVNIYDSVFDAGTEFKFNDAKTVHELYLKSMGIDLRMLNLAVDMERVYISGAVDHDLNKNIHEFSTVGGAKASANAVAVACQEGAIRGLILPYDYKEAQRIVNEEFKDLKWEKPEMKNLCGGASDANDDDEEQSGGGLFDWFSSQPKENPEPPKEKKGLFDWLFKPNAQPSSEQPVQPAPMPAPVPEKPMPAPMPEKPMPAPAPFSNILKSGGAPSVINYNSTQKFISEFFKPSLNRKGMLLSHSVGTGKCHARNTPIIMYDGSVKMVQDIQVGDQLMGDNSKPRNVLSLATGTDMMYRIVPTKGDPYIVNSEHILCLKPTNTGIKYIKNGNAKPYCATWIDTKTIKIKSKYFLNKEEAEEHIERIQKENNVIEIEVKEYLKLSNSIKNNIKGYRTGVEFASKPVNFDPYIIGYWLGDGSKRDPVITSQDSTVLHYIHQTVSKMGLLLNYQSQYDYRISSTDGNNVFLNALKKYNLINNKHIPLDYLANNRETRLKILAGLIDSDGYFDNIGKGYEITQKSDTLANNILYLCRSLGFAAYSKKCEKSCKHKENTFTGVYNRIFISGTGLEEIPCKIPRKQIHEKRLINKDALVTGIKVEPLTEDTYYGFTLDGNNRYLLGDFTVTHNTCSAIAAATNSFETEGYTILWVTRTTLKNDIWKNMFDQICSATIADAFKKGLVSAAELEDPKRRMKLLSKAWAIKPMSYKQFSNLVSGKNALYKALVKRNGAADPLTKTLLIIDEAHKLYGESDLSAIERPDTTALYESVMRSYEISGKDSVRLLLMTATPITTSPMELVQLINLCRERTDKIEDNFNLFAETYLNSEGMFTKAGERRFLNEIAGHISHLNREKDARMFSQPVISFVRVPLLSEPYYNQYDPQLVRGIAQARMAAIKKRVENNNENIMAFNLSKTEEAAIKGTCETYEEPREQKACKQIVRKTLKNIKSHIRDTKRILRDENKAVREEYKEINNSIKEKVAKAREMVNERKAFYDEKRASSRSSRSSHSSRSSSSQSSLSSEKRSSSSSASKGGGYETDEEEEARKAAALEPFFAAEKKPIFGLDDDYQKYKQSVFYNIKEKCKLKPKRATFNNYPKIQEHLSNISAYENSINQNKTALKMERKNAATRLKTMKQNTLKKGLNPIERATMLQEIKNETRKIRRHFKQRAQQVALINKDINESIKTHKGQIKEYKKTLEHAYKKTKRLKLKLEKKRRRESLKLGKTLDELNADAIELSDEFKTKQRELREFIDENREAMMRDITHDVGEVKEMAEATLRMKEAQAQAKAEERARKAEEKEEERARKEAEKARKAEEKAEEKARKAEEKARKEAEKAAKKKG